MRFLYSDGNNVMVVDFDDLDDYKEWMGNVEAIKSSIGLISQ